MWFKQKSINLLSSLLQKAAALTGLLVLSPLVVILLVLIPAINRMHPVFKQKRTGRNGKIFLLYKFQTIKNSKVTGLGSLLRSTGIDEIPQLVNVLLGQMSFIGPRPLLPEYLPHYTDFENIRHQTKPGITGLAQVRGGKNLGWEHQFRYDVFYVKNRCLWLDLLILCQSVISVVKKDKSKAHEERKWTRSDIS